MKKLLSIMLLLLMVFCLNGCQNGSTQADIAPAATQTVSVEDYLEAVRNQSDAIKASLLQEALTQADMNQLSKELCDLWDAALDYLLEEAEKVLPADEMAKLTAEQKAWLEFKLKAVEAAGQEFEGGSIYALVVNSEAAKLTENRAYEVYELFQ